MARVQVSKNLYRGCRIENVGEVEILALNHESIAWLREDGTYLVRPAYFFSLWGNDVLEERLENMYYTTPYRSFWAWLRSFSAKKSKKCCSIKKFVYLCTIESKQVRTRTTA